MGETFNRIKRALQTLRTKTADSAEKVSDSQTYTDSNNAKENRDHESRGKKLLVSVRLMT